MAAVEPLCNVIDINSKLLSREENLIVEAELFIRVCDELRDLFKVFNKEYLRLLKLDYERENMMIEADFLRHVVQDILMSKEYSVEGIAYYTQIPEEVITDLMLGKNAEPSLPLSRKIIDLHRSVRPNLYREIMKKVASEYLQLE